MDNTDDLKKLMTSLMDRDYSELERHLDLMISTLCGFTPNKPNIHERIRKKFDIQLLLIMLSHNAYDSNDMFYLVCDIEALCKGYASPSRDDLISSNFMDLKARVEFNGNEQQQVTSFFVYFVDVIECILCMIRTDIDEYLASKRFANDYEILTSESGQEWLHNKSNTS